MSNNLNNTTVAGTSITSTAKKSVRKSCFVVRQTLTSKLRAERGDKLQFIKKELQKADEHSNCSSKESLNSVDKFKKPNYNHFKTPSNNKHSTAIPKLTTADRIVSNTNNKSVKFEIKNNANKKLINNTPKPGTSINSTKNEKLINNTPKPGTSKNSTKNEKLINNTSRFTASINNIKKITAKPAYISNSNKSVLPKNNEFKNRFTLTSNQIKTTLSGKFSLLPNQIKPISSKPDDRRKTLMPNKIKSTLPKDKLKQQSETTNNIRKPTLKPAGSVSSVKKSVTVQSPVRKSLSAIHFKRVSNYNRKSTIHRTKSWSDGMSPEGVFRSPGKTEPLFRTPTMAQRRSVAYLTPLSISKKSMSPFTVISSPKSADLKRRLSLWLEKRGKPLDSFHHLRCFGLNTNSEVIEENKENFELFIPDKDSSYENLNISPIKKIEDKSKNISVANDAMYDLHKLILEGYARDQCEAWLDLICSKFREITENAQYWECRAALEEVRGNYQKAIDCYSNAIAKGAKVEKVNEPLDNLLEKFSVLNISQTENCPNVDQQLESSLDARNVFKSTLIGFAVQERAKMSRKKSRDEESKFVATPVRRSTRMSRSHFVSTPNVQFCATLEDLDSPVRDSLQFQTNRGFKH